jgi:hypothetical protein
VIVGLFRFEPYPVVTWILLGVVKTVDENLVRDPIRECVAGITERISRGMKMLACGAFGFRTDHD